MYLILVICINWCAVLVRETLFGFLYEWGTAIHLSGLCFNSLILLLFAPACTTRHNNHDQAGHKRNCDNNVGHLISLALGHCGPNKPSRAQQYFSASNLLRPNKTSSAQKKERREGASRRTRRKPLKPSHPHRAAAAAPARRDGRRPHCRRRGPRRGRRRPRRGERPRLSPLPPCCGVGDPTCARAGLPPPRLEPGLARLASPRPDPPARVPAPHT